MVRRNQRDIAGRPIQHNVVQCVVGCRRINPLVGDRDGRRSGPRCPRRSQQPPLRRTQPRSVPHVGSRQRDVARPLIDRHVAQRVVGRRGVRPLIIQPCTADGRSVATSRPGRANRSLRPGRPRSSGCANRSLRPGRPRSSGCSRRPLRPGRPWKPLRPGRPWKPLRPGRPCGSYRPCSPSRPRSSRRPRIHQLHIQRWCVCRQVVLLAVELHHRGPSRERQSIVRRGRADPSLHQRRHIHRDERPGLAHRKDPGRAAHRWLGRIGHAVLAPGPGDRPKCHQPRRGHPVAVEPQHGARHLPRRRPGRQQRQVELQQRGIAPAHVQIGDCPAIRRGQRAVHMRIGHQRHFGAPGLRPRAPQQHRTQQNHPHHHYPRPPAEPLSNHGQFPPRSPCPFRLQATPVAWPLCPAGPRTGRWATQRFQRSLLDDSRCHGSRAEDATSWSKTDLELYRFRTPQHE